MPKRFTLEFFVIGLKMGLVHELTDLIIKNGSSRRNKKLGRTMAYCISRLSTIQTYDRKRAREELLDALREAHTHVVIFNQVTDQGMGRETNWKVIWFESYELLRDSNENQVS